MSPFIWNAVLDRMTPNFWPCVRRTFLYFSPNPPHLPQQSFFVFILPWVISEEIWYRRIYLTPMPFYPGIYKRHPLRLFILWACMLHVIRSLKTTQVFVGRGVEVLRAQDSESEDLSLSPNSVTYNHMILVICSSVYSSVQWE